MADAATTLAELKDIVRRFVLERDWQQYHAPKNLAMGVAVEAAELMEHFLWVDSPASFAVVNETGKREQIAEELADVFCHLLNLSMALDIDLSDALQTKMIKNAVKYPADVYRGKYTV
jgi:NTP pyrophosphatase (non-canonical NTP hydrolase)